MSTLRAAALLLCAASCLTLGAPAPSPGGTMGAAAAAPSAPPAPVSAPEPTEPPQRVALMQLRPSDPSSEALTKTLTELVAYELEDSRRFKVLAPTDLAEALKLKGLQQGLGCESDACQADLAKSVDVPRFVSGSLGKMGDKYVLLLKLVDAEGVSVVKQSRDFAAGREEELLAAAHRTSWELAGLDVPRPADSTNTTPAQQHDSTGRSGNDAFNRIAALGAAGALQGAVQGLGRGLSSGMGAIGQAIAPALTAELEAALAQGLAARLAELRALRPRTGP